jgi:hypothetical protein
MERVSNIFEKTTISSKTIIDKIKRGDWDDVLHNLCNIKDNDIIVDYTCFKLVANTSTYDVIIMLVCKNIDNVLLTNDTVSIHINLKALSVLDIDKHKQFIQTFACFMKEKYPNKLAKCYVYNAPFVFAQLLNVLCLFIDKETQAKIVLI